MKGTSNKLTSLLKDYNYKDKELTKSYERAQKKFVSLISKGLAQERGYQLREPNSKPTNSMINNNKTVYFK